MWSEMSAAPDTAEATEYLWPSDTNERLENEIVRLLRETSAATPIIGFGTTIDDAEAETYLRELRQNLRAGKCRLLEIRHHGELIALCTLRRNLNPNNRHIVDLAKGMIAEAHRGGMILPTAFYEIALQCERDGAELVTLDVRADTTAHHVWERFGFEIYGTLKDYARANGQSLAGHYMMQKVSDLKQRSLQILRKKLAQKLGPEGLNSERTSAV